MLWLMHRWRLIRVAQSRAHGAKRFPHAWVQALTGDRLRVVSPSSQRVLVLDTHYSANSIVDPYSGAMIWVPPLATNSAPADSASTSAAPSRAAAGRADGTGAAPPKLKLDEPAKPTRQRWFKKS